MNQETEEVAPMDINEAKRWANADEHEQPSSTFNYRPVLIVCARLAVAEHERAERAEARVSVVQVELTLAQVRADRLERERDAERERADELARERNKALEEGKREDIDDWIDDLYHRMAETEKRLATLTRRVERLDGRLP